MKKRAIIAVSVFLAIAVITTVVALIATSINQGKKVVMQVDAQPVVSDEYILYITIYQ